MDGEISVASDFRDRLSFAHIMPAKNISIIINRTLASDAGQYICNVNLKTEEISGSSNIGVVDVSILGESRKG